MSQCNGNMPTLEALVPHTPTTGWIAISEQFYQGFREGYVLLDPCEPFSFISSSGKHLSPDAFRWLHAYEPIARPGGSIRLTTFPDPHGRPVRGGILYFLRIERSPPPTLDPPSSRYRLCSVRRSQVARRRQGTL
jgi:hypothetical protein